MLSDKIAQISQISQLDLEYPDESQIQFLTSRPWYSKEHDQLNLILNSIVPQTHIVAPFGAHVQIDTNQVMLTNPAELNVKLIKMIQSGCHDNCEILFENGKINKICTGYALSKDGLWRFHSWGFDNENNLVETTEPRLLYWGNVVLS